VLVVDDDRMQLRAIERVLRDRAEIELTVADNAIDAMIAVGALRPDLVIMDILMPGLDGIEAGMVVMLNGLSAFWMLRTNELKAEMPASEEVVPESSYLPNTATTFSTPSFQTWSYSGYLPVVLSAESETSAVVLTMSAAARLHSSGR
jgi:hypothetical protein